MVLGCRACRFSWLAKLVASIAKYLLFGEPSVKRLLMFFNSLPPAELCLEFCYWDSIWCRLIRLLNKHFYSTIVSHDSCWPTFRGGPCGDRILKGLWSFDCFRDLDFSLWLVLKYNGSTFSSFFSFFAFWNSSIFSRSNQNLDYGGFFESLSAISKGFYSIWEVFWSLGTFLISDRSKVCSYRWPLRYLESCFFIFNFLFGLSIMS